MGIDKQVVCSKTTSRHIYLVEYNLSLLPAISKLPICIIVVPNIYFSDNSSYTLSDVVPQR